MKKPLLKLSVFALVAFLFVTAGCGDNKNPLKDIENSLKNAGDYSIILEDMKEEGNFFKKYYHKYKIVRQGKSDSTTGWLEVTEDFFRANAPLLGMAIAGMAGGKRLAAAAPPGYQYVGNTRYGRWERDSMGRYFWLFSPAMPYFGTYYYNKPIYRTGYQRYKKTAAKRKIPYFGSKNEFGTNGSFTKKTKPTFFARRMAKERARKASFSQRVGRRIGRTRTNFRGRSGGRGK